MRVVNNLNGFGLYRAMTCFNETWFYVFIMIKP